MPKTYSSILKKASSSTRYLVRSYGTPEHDFDSSDQAFRAQRYEILYQLANGVAYSDPNIWEEYAKTFGTYRFTRQLWDNARILIDFYKYRVWNGVIANDGMNLPHGLINAVPLAEDTDPALAKAIAALLIGWSFQTRMDVLVDTTATCGELLCELQDDPSAGEIELDMVWPAYVKDIDLTSKDTINEYVLEYWVRDQEYDVRKDSLHTVREYLYRKEVDRKQIRTFKDRQEFGYDDNLAIIDHPYGFVPAAWFRHHRRLGSRGESAISSMMGITDEVNSLLSHLVDKTHVNLRSPVVVSGNLTLSSLQSAIGNMATNVKRAVTSALSRSTDLRQEQDILQAPVGTKVETIQVDLRSTIDVADFLKAGAEKKAPEVMVFEEIRKMTQITGPSADRLFGDVVPKYKAISSASYDIQLIHLIQMGVAMSGWRVNSGAWDGTKTIDENGAPVSGLTEMQERFRPFGLASYGRGELDITVMPRKLFDETESELLDIETKKRLVLPSLPEEIVAEELGYEKDKFTGYIKLAEQKAEEKAQQEQQRQVELVQSRPVSQPSNGRV